MKSNIRRFRFHTTNTLVFSAFSLWFFYLIFDTFDYLNFSEVSWFGIDNTTSYIAQLFFINDNWTFPLLRNPGYGDVLSTSLTFTGPSPILALPMKIFGISPEIQFFGLWILLNIVLQLIFGYRFLRLLGGSVIFSRIFTIFFITPFFIIKTQGHFWLTSHYLILWSLCILFGYLLKRVYKAREVSLLLCLSYLTNIYLLATVLSVVSLTVILRLFSSQRNLRAILSDIATALFTLLLTFFLFDGINRQETIYESVKMYLSSTYGYHGFNLLTFINPDTGIVAEGLPNIPNNLPIFSVLPISLGMIPGAYEGFMYLGLGTLLASVFAFFTRGHTKSKSGIVLEKNQRRVIILATLLLTLFAVSYRVGFGSWSIVLPFPTYLDWLLGTFRSSGRFMWPVAYALIGIVLIGLHRFVTSRVNHKAKFILLFTIIAIQVIDISVPLIRQEKEIILTINNNNFRSNKFLEASEVLKPYKSIRAYPQGDFLENHYAELNYLAWTLNIRTDLHFSSRINMNALYKREEETWNDLCSGNLRPFVAYAVTNERAEDLASCYKKLEPIFEDEFHAYYGILP